MSGGPFIARASKGKIALILLGGLAAAAACAFILLNPGEVRDVSIGGIRIPIGWFAWAGVGFLVLCIPPWLRQMFLAGPVIEVSSAGIRWRNWSEDLIPWSAIERLRITRIQRQSFVSVWLRDPDTYRSTTLAGRMARANKAMGFGDIAIGTMGTDRSFDEFASDVAFFAPEQLFER